MTGDAVQNVSNPIFQARFIKKSEAKELDKIREDYVSLIEEAYELEQKGKTEKAEAKRQSAEGAMLVYREKAEELGLSVTNVDVAVGAVSPSQTNPLVPEGIKLTKAQRKEIEKLEKQIEKYQKKLGKYSEEFIYKANRTVPEELTKDQKEVLYYQQELGKVQAEYQEKTKEYGIPTVNDIIDKLYSIEDPIKASKIRDQIKDELKDANMYFGFTKDYLKDDQFENVSEVLAIRNRVNSNIERGYVGTSASNVKKYEGQDAADVASEYAQAAGADLTFNRRSNERRIAQLSQNVEYFNVENIEENKGKKVSEIPTVTIDGQEIKTSEIDRVTTLAGGVYTKADGLENIKLGDIRTIEVGGKQYSLAPIYKEKGDENYSTRRQVKRLGKDIGYEYEGLKLGKAVANTALASIPAVAAAALDVFKVEFHDRVSLGMNWDMGNIESTVFDEMYKKIEDQLKKMAEENGGKYDITKLGDVIGFEYIKELDIESTHLCAAPVIATAATAFIASIVDQAMKKEEIVPEKAYHAAREKLTLEMKHNAAGGDGYILNEKELDKVMADVLQLVNKTLKTPTEPVVQQPVAEKPVAEKVALFKTEDVHPLVKETEDCVYHNKSGEYWDGIIRLGYVDANGKAISNEADIAELRKFIKGELNGFKPSEANMPKTEVGVKLRRTYTCKSGNTYTWSLCEKEPDATLRDKYTSKDAARDRNGNPISSRMVDGRVSMESTQYVTTPGKYSWSWADQNDRLNFGSGVYGTIEERNAALEKEKENLAGRGYTIK